MYNNILQTCSLMLQQIILQDRDRGTYLLSEVSSRIDINPNNRLSTACRRQVHIQHSQRSSPRLLSSLSTSISIRIQDALPSSPPPTLPTKLPYPYIFSPPPFASMLALLCGAQENARDNAIEKTIMRFATFPLKTHWIFVRRIYDVFNSQKISFDINMMPLTSHRCMRYNYAVFNKDILSH